MHWTLLLRTGNLVCSPVWPHCLRGFNFSSHSEVNYRVTRRVVKRLEREKLDSAPLSALFVKTERKWWSIEWKIWSGQNPHNGGKERSRLAGNQSQKEQGPMMSWKNFERDKTCMSCCVKHYFPLSATTLIMTGQVEVLTWLCAAYLIIVLFVPSCWDWNQNVRQ